MIKCPHCGGAINSIKPTKPQLLLCDIEMVEAIFGSGATWEYKFDRIFGMSNGIRALLNELNISFDWTDPDTTYEEDVTAYVNALRAVKENVVQELERAPADSVADFAAAFRCQNIKDLIPKP